MRVRRILTALVCVAALAIAPATAPASPADSAPIAIASKTCSAGFTHAVIGGAQKCLRRGEFCASRYHRQYPRYGYHCVVGRLR